METPTVLALLDEDDDGSERIVGWLLVLDTEVVSYQPGRDGHAFGTFSSLESAEGLLGLCGLTVSRPTSGATG